MLQIRFAEYEELLRRLESFVGQRLLISESVSRNRESGHDRHFAVRAQFEMRLDHVGTAVSGAQLMLDGEGGFCCGISAGSIVSTSLSPDRVEITEWYEAKTERKTTLRVLR